MKRGVHKQTRRRSFMLGRSFIVNMLKIQDLIVNSVFLDVNKGQNVDQVTLATGNVAESTRCKDRSVGGPKGRDCNGQRHQPRHWSFKNRKFN